MIKKKQKQTNAVKARKSKKEISDEEKGIFWYTDGSALLLNLLIEAVEPYARNEKHPHKCEKDDK